MIKLAVFDIDGVLRTPEKIFPETIAALKQLQDAGIYCTVATGRGFPRTFDLLEAFSPNAPLVVENGGRLVERDGKEISFHPIERHVIQKSRPMLDRESLMLATFVEREGEKYRFFVPGEGGVKKIEQWPSLTIGEQTNDPDQFLAWAENLSCAKIAFLPQPGQPLEVPQDLAASFNFNAYDIGPEGIDKGTGVKELASILNVSLDETLIAGDDLNDVPMFLGDAKIKIAVGNHGPSVLRERASHHIEGPQHLAQILSSIFPGILVPQSS